VAVSYGGESVLPPVVEAIRRIRPVLLHTSLPRFRPDRARALAALLADKTLANVVIVTHGLSGMTMLLSDGSLLEPMAPTSEWAPGELAALLTTKVLARLSGRERGQTSMLGSNVSSR
jgi:hypothetical protein